MGTPIQFEYSERASSRTTPKRTKKSKETKEREKQKQKQSCREWNSTHPHPTKGMTWHVKERESCRWLPLFVDERMEEEYRRDKRCGRGWEEKNQQNEKLEQWQRKSFRQIHEWTAPGPSRARIVWLASKSQHSTPTTSWSCPANPSEYSNCNQRKIWKSWHKGHKKTSILLLQSVYSHPRTHCLPLLSLTHKFYLSPLFSHIYMLT